MSTAMVSRKGQIIAFFAFFLLIMLSAAVVVLLREGKNYALGDEFGELRRAEYRLQLLGFLQESAVKWKAYSLLQQQADRGGFFSGCNRMKGVAVWNGSCVPHTVAVFDNFTAGLSSAQNTSLSFTSDGAFVHVNGTGVFVTYLGTHVNMTFTPMYDFVLDFDFGQYDRAWGILQEKHGCIHDTPYSELFDEMNSLVRMCGLPQDWQVSKDDSYAYVAVPGWQTFFGENITIRGAIPL